MLISPVTGRSGRGAGPSTPFYFGPEHRRYGLVTWPDGPVRAAAVICPPLAYEAVTSYLSLRVLADQLAAAGIVALRIDYAGSGNAPESERGEADVSDWTQTVTDAVDTVRGWGISTVITVGVRFGAGIALASAADQPVEYAVLWDPIPSGRRYARAVKMMAAATATSAASEDGNAGGVTIAGIEFSDAVLKGMGKINITPTALPVSTLVLLRPTTTDEEWPADPAAVEAGTAVQQAPPASRSPTSCACPERPR